MIEGESRYKHVGIDLPQLEEVLAGYKAQHPGARCEAAKVVNAVLNLYVAGELAPEEEEFFWVDPDRNGQARRNVNVYPELMASVLNAYRKRHDTPFGNNTGWSGSCCGCTSRTWRRGRETDRGVLTGWPTRTRETPPTIAQVARGRRFLSLPIPTTLPAEL